MEVTDQLVSGHRLKIPVCLRDDYQILYENLEGHIFVHVDMLRWSSQVFRRFLADVRALHSLLGRTVYARAEPDDTKHHRFLTLCGFRRGGICYAADGHLMLGFELPQQET